jgi:hypothetical protein
MEQIALHIDAHILGYIAALVVLHNFLNNLAANIPALKGNTWFQCLAGGINAIIETSQGKKTEVTDFQSAMAKAADTLKEQ